MMFRNVNSQKEMPILTCPSNIRGQTMAQQLPSEIWSHVFGYLSPEDKYSVRASSKYFKKLADHKSLWKDWSVVLGFRKSSYNGRFWTSLNRREVASVVLRGSQAKDWEKVGVLLPSLTTVVVDHSCHASLGCVKNFPNLKRLAIRISCIYLLPDAAAGSQPQQLTHLSMCDVTFSSAGRRDGLMPALSQFTNLTSLVCHQMDIFEEPIRMVHSILNCLPKLKHLLLAIVSNALQNIIRPDPGPLGGAGGAVLSSLELIDCIGSSLPDDLMRLMPSLKTLAVFHRHQEMPGRHPSPAGHHLETWLSHLPQLSTLVVAKGPPVEKYVASIPATVTSLTLCVTGLSSENMEAVAVQVPNLLHLHIDPWPSHMGPCIAQIPGLFPKLKSLKLRHEHVLERDFLHLHQLQDLKYLEILDSRPHLSELTNKLRHLTKYPLQVMTPPRRRDLLSCPCVSQVY